MDYVVTGGAGYIGGHLVDELVNENKVTVFDDFSSGHYINKRAKVVKCDLRKGCPKIPKGATVIHLAANPDVKGSMMNPKSHFERDVTATLNVMEAARKADTRAVMFASSSTIYGNAKKRPTPEGYQQSPISNYGLFKLMGENAVRGYSEMYGIRAVSLRFANIVGGRTSHGIVYNFAKRVKAGKPIEVWGDGRQRKSYVYITDLIKAVRILEKKSKAGYCAFNIGNVDSTSVNDTVQMLNELLGRKPKVRHTGNQPGDVRAMLLDIKKIRAYGWKPTYKSSRSVKVALSDLLQQRS